MNAIPKRFLSISLHCHSISICTSKRGNVAGITYVSNVHAFVILIFPTRIWVSAVVCRVFKPCKRPFKSKAQIIHSHSLLYCGPMYIVRTTCMNMYEIYAFTLISNTFLIYTRDIYFISVRTFITIWILFSLKNHTEIYGVLCSFIHLLRF